MNRQPLHRLSSVFVLAVTLFCGGCKPAHQESGEAHASHSENHGHEHGEESPSGASFKEGKGVMLMGDTVKSIGLQTVDVIEKNLPGQIPITLQVFEERHTHREASDDHSACAFQASGFLDAKTAQKITPGTAVEIPSKGGGKLTGKVLSVQKALALGESELVVGFSPLRPEWSAHSFHQASIQLPPSEALPTIPAAALLQTAEGYFVYTVNGDAYFRTPVKVASRSEEWIAISDGLLAGDQVVTHPVQTLWLIELRATKGGGHCH